MPFIISAEQYSQDQKMQECGMLWEAAMKRFLNLQRRKNVIKEHNHQKTVKELRCIKWGNFTIQWDHNSR